MTLLANKDKACVRKFSQLYFILAMYSPRGLKFTALRRSRLTALQCSIFTVNVLKNTFLQHMKTPSSLPIFCNAIFGADYLLCLFAKYRYYFRFLNHILSSLCNVRPSRVGEYFYSIYATVYSRGVKLAARGPNPARHATFCVPRHTSFMLALVLTGLCLLFCHSRLRFFVYSHNSTLRLHN